MTSVETVELGEGFGVRIISQPRRASEHQLIYELIYEGERTGAPVVRVYSATEPWVGEPEGPTAHFSTTAPEGITPEELAAFTAMLRMAREAIPVEKGEQA